MQLPMTHSTEIGLLEVGTAVDGMADSKLVDVLSLMASGSPCWKSNSSSSAVRQLLQAYAKKLMSKYSALPRTPKQGLF